MSDELLSREAAYEANVLSGWRAMQYGATATNSNGLWRKAAGNGTYTWGLSEGSLPMGATGYVRVDSANATAASNNIAQNDTPLVVGETYTVGCYVRGRGVADIFLEQDGNARIARAEVDGDRWRFVSGTFTAKATPQNFYLSNGTSSSSALAGALDICAPLLVRGGVASMILCNCEVTITDETDIDSLVTWFKWSSSATLPSAPTTTQTSQSVSGWQVTEPGISTAADAAGYVYTVVQTRWKDGSCTWGSVSRSAAFEAAKIAWNKAAATQSELDGLEIGGRNLIPSAIFTSVGIPGSTKELGPASLGTMHTNFNLDGAYILNDFEPGTQYTFRVGALAANPDAQASTKAGPYFRFHYSDGTIQSLQFNYGLSTTRYQTMTSTAGKTVERLTATYGNAGTTWTFYDMKLEKGNKATDWTPAPEDMASATESVEYIVGTQTAATGSWTGVTKDTALYSGKTIAYKLPYAGSGNASLQLKDSAGNNVGGNVAVYLTTTRVTTHFGAGSVINMTYDGSSWRASSIPNTNNVDRSQYAVAAAAGEAIAAARVAGFGTDGKLYLLGTGPVDISRPLLYVGTAYTAANVTSVTTRTSNYSFWGTAFAISSTHAITGAAAGKVCYLVGTLSGSVLTPTADVLTCEEPTAADGLVYARVGMMSTAANGVLDGQHPLYAFIGGAFRQMDVAALGVADAVEEFVGPARSVTGDTSGDGAEEGEVTTFSSLEERLGYERTLWDDAIDASERRVTAEWQREADRIGSLLTERYVTNDALVESTSELANTIEGIEANFSQTVTGLATGAELGEARAEVDKLTSFVHVTQRVATVGGVDVAYPEMTLGSDDVDDDGVPKQPVKARMTNSGLDFEYLGEVVASIHADASGKGVLQVANATATDEIHMGGWLIYARSNGNLSFKYVG